MAPRPEGPFDRLLRSKPERDPAPFIIGGTIALLALLIALLFLLSSVLSGGDGGKKVESVEGLVAELSDMPGLPPGLTAASDFVKFTAEKDLAATIEMKLKDQSESAADLGFYTYSDGRWQNVSAVRLSQNGKAGAAEFTPVPANLAILRAGNRSYQIAGSLPAATTLHPDARVNIISPRDYTPKADGSVQGQAANAQQSPGVLLIPTIVGSGESEASAVNQILGDDALRQKHIEAITSLVSAEKFAGIDIEYTAVDTARGQAFTEFVKALAEDLHRNGARLSLTLPPSTDERQPYDWKTLGEAADMIKLLPVNDPASYWSKMPAALDRLTKDVDTKKIMLVINPYSVKRTGGTFEPIGYRQAMFLAGELAAREPGDVQNLKAGTSVKLVAVNIDEGERGAPPRWNDEMASVIFSVGGRQPATVYLENSFSLGFKLEIAQAYALGGISIADASSEADVYNIWSEVNDLVQSGTVRLIRPNNEALTPRWQSPDGGDIQGTGTKAAWQAPSERGKYAIELVVSDGVERFGRRLTVEVTSGPETATPAPSFAPDPTPTPKPTTTPTATPKPSPSPTPSATVDRTPPGAVIGLVASPGPPSGRVVLNWVPNSESDVDHYNIWRGTEEGELHSFLDSVDANTSRYTDSGLSSDETYYYVVTAVDEAGNEGPISNEASARPSP